MHELSFYSFYDYYTPDYLQFVKNLSHRLGGTIHVSYFHFCDHDSVLPEKHFINFFQSELFYLDVRFVDITESQDVFYTLRLSSGISILDALEIHFLPNNLIRILHFHPHMNWSMFNDLLANHIVYRDSFFRLLRVPYIFKFLHTLSKIGCSNLYFFPCGKYSFETHLNTLFIKVCSEEHLINNYLNKEKIKLYTNTSIWEYLNPSIKESLLDKRNVKFKKYGVFKLVLA